MKNVFLETENVHKFRAAAGVIEDTEKGQPGIFVATGRAGRGKTECSREYAVRRGALYLRVMQDWTPRAMLAALCAMINGSSPGTVEKCRNYLIHILSVSRRTIIVDEADRLSNLSLIEHFRDIHDMTGAPIILVGEQNLYTSISSKRRLWSRVTQTVEFGPTTTQDIMVFGMKAAELKIEPEAAALIGKKTEGDFRLIWQAVRSLESMSRAAGTQQVSVKMVQEISDRKPLPVK